MAKIDWDIRITFNNLMVAFVSIPLILTFMVLSYQLITTAFVNDQVRQDIEKIGGKASSYPCDTTDKAQVHNTQEADSPKCSTTMPREYNIHILTPRKKA